MQWRKANLYSVHPKPPKVKIHSTLGGPAFLGERLPIHIHVQNAEDESVSLTITYNCVDSHGNEGIRLEESLLTQHCRTNSTGVQILRSRVINRFQSERCVKMRNGNLH
jgi:hypothetical protein